MEGTGVDAGPLAASVDAGPSLPASVDAGPSMPADVLEAQPREQAAVHARDRAAVQESEVNARNVRARRMDAPRQSSGAPNETADDPEEDPHNLHRFVLRQREDHNDALAQLREGHKAGCWSWWIMPTPPFIKNGREVGSGMNAKYALRGDGEGAAYLCYRGGLLRSNYLEIMAAVADQLAAGTAPARLLGIDVPRCAASAKHFARLAAQADDEELGAVCDRVVALLESKKAPEGVSKRF